MTDDVYSIRFAWLTHGKVPPTELKPHDKFLAEFPAEFAIEVCVSLP